MGLVPMDDEASMQLQRIRNGSVVRADYKERRNGQFFRKWWALVDVAFDLWSDKVNHGNPNSATRMCRETFRKQLICRTGRFTNVFNLDGETFTMVPHSLQWSKMTEDEFHKLYHDTLDVILQTVLTDRWQADLEDRVERVLHFA